MWAFVVSDDAELVATALAKNDDPAVLLAGLKAAAGALYDVSSANKALACTVRQLASDPAADVDVRVAAVRAAGCSRDPCFEPTMTELLSDSSLPVGAAAARALLKRSVERFRDVVEPIMASWPTDDRAPYDVVEARRLLDDDRDDGWA
jgi:HEAT repeat protein